MSAKLKTVGEKVRETVHDIYAFYPNTHHDSEGYVTKLVLAAVAYGQVCAVSERDKRISDLEAALKPFATIAHDILTTEIAEHFTVEDAETENPTSGKHGVFVNTEALMAATKALQPAPKV